MPDEDDLDTEIDAEELAEEVDTADVPDQVDGPQDEVEEDPEDG